MFNDVPVVSYYGTLSAQFHIGGSRLIEMVGFMLFFYFVLEQLLKCTLVVFSLEQFVYTELLAGFHESVSIQAYMFDKNLFKNLTCYVFIADFNVAV